MKCEKRWETNTHYGKKNSPNEGQIVHGKGTELYISIVDLCLKQRGELKYCNRRSMHNHENKKKDSRSHNPNSITAIFPYKAECTLLISMTVFFDSIPSSTWQHFDDTHFSVDSLLLLHKMIIRIKIINIQESSMSSNSQKSIIERPIQKLSTQISNGSSWKEILAEWNRKTRSTTTILISISRATRE